MEIIIAKAVIYFSRFLNMVIFIRVILSWFPINHNGPFMRLLYSLTEPILGPIRSLLEKSPIGGKGMMLDFSPIIAVLLIYFAQVAILSLLF